MWKYFYSFLFIINLSMGIIKKITHPDELLSAIYILVAAVLFCAVIEGIVDEIKNSIKDLLEG